ncbi:hypothetical protein QTG56_25795 (plasmid) [Rossellomorea sp. AcN35-11]|nr:hypothetical protein [Rossellomorea aquimaris]WJV32030.1 hypothetical protein QTG56_25795 [Rossellomorea sp. AcN35-11]
MKKSLVLIAFISALLVSACGNDENAMEKEKVKLVEDVLTAILNDDSETLDAKYIPAVLSTEELLKIKSEWGIKDLKTKDFTFEKVGEFTYHAVHQETKLTFRVMEKEGTSKIDFITKL